MPALFRFLFSRPGTAVRARTLSAVPFLAIAVLIADIAPAAAPSVTVGEAQATLVRDWNRLYWTGEDYSDEPFSPDAVITLTLRNTSDATDHLGRVSGPENLAMGLYAVAEDRRDGVLVRPVHPLRRLELEPGQAFRLRSYTAFIALWVRQGSLVPGDELELTLYFSCSGPVTVTAPVIGEENAGRR